MFGQTIATSAEVTPNGRLVRESPPISMMIRGLATLGNTALGLNSVSFCIVSSRHCGRVAFTAPTRGAAVRRKGIPPKSPSFRFRNYTNLPRLCGKWGDETPEVHEKKPGWLGDIGDESLPNYIGTSS